MLDSIEEFLLGSNIALFFIFGTIFICLFINFFITLVIAHSMRHSNDWPGNSKTIKETISSNKTLRLCAVLGSGGHTTEMISLVKQLNPNLFMPRQYIVAETDSLSANKVVEMEKQFQPKVNHNSNSYEITLIPRSRKVGQSYLTSIFTTLWAIFISIKIVWQSKPDMVLCNGPGTCLPICIIAYVLDLLRLRNTKIVFVESTCRVKTLSLTGKLLYHFRMADVFLVQWPDLVEKYPRAEFIGIVN
uniref:UDP-N-acetylglucosamine transferase subunit ALG14 n=1 Tax=Panagrolaimus sp. JU765 TaxID=591449 RepID=A0AC34RI54_9BILA